MSTFLQPAYGPYPPEPDPLAIEQLLPLSTEEVSAVIAGLSVPERLDIVRELHDRRKAARDEQDFEDQVELDRARRRAKKEGLARDRAEQDAHLSSPEGRAEAAARFEAQIIDLDDLEEPEPVIEGFLNRDSMARTFGPPKSLKSFATLDMAACVSLGIPWQGHPTQQQVVLYVVAEGVRGVKKRRAAWNEHHGTDMKVIFFPKPVQIGDQEAMHDLISFCLVKQVGYVVFDTQARCTVGVNENDNTEMGEIVAGLDILKQQTGACVHLVHHSVGANDDKARGATAWDGAIDTEFVVKRDKDKGTLKLVTKFQKDDIEADDVFMETREVGSSIVLVPSGSGGEGGPARTGEVAPALVSDANAFYLEAIRQFGNQVVTVTDVERDFKDRRIERSRSAIKKAFGTLDANGAIQPEGSGTGVRLTQAGLVFSDRWRKQRAETPSDQGVIEGVIEDHVTPTNDTL